MFSAKVSNSIIKSKSSLMHLKLLERLKCKSQNENIKRKSWARSLICNTSRVRRVCWTFKMETRMSDKQVNYSYGFTQTEQQVGYNILYDWLQGLLLKG
jgi:hypothetical protein